jgi:hypothetical protein
MSLDQSLPLRRAIVTRLRADGPLTALVPAERLYGMRTPAAVTWPFGRYGAPNTLPRRATCSDGSRVDVPYHFFSKADYDDEVGELVAAAVKSLGDAVLALDTGARARLVWTGSTILPDAAEASAWHGIARFEATIV